MGIQGVDMAVNIHQAKTHFSKLIEKVMRGEEVVIAKGGRPVARLVPIQPAQQPRRPGSAKGRVTVAPDFDAPLPEELLRSFAE